MKGKTLPPHVALVVKELRERARICKNAGLDASAKDIRRRLRALLKEHAK